MELCPEGCRLRAGGRALALCAVLLAQMGCTSPGGLSNNSVAGSGSADPANGPGLAGDGSAGAAPYDVAITPAGSFAAYGAGSDPAPIPANPVFGPGSGYPEPAAVATQDFGVLDRGSVIVFETSVGDLSEVVATIEGEPVAPEEGSTATRIGFAIPFTLEDGPHRLELRDPSGEVLIARATFEVRVVILGG